MAVCCCSLAGTAACRHCASNPFATDVWTNKAVTVDHIDAKPFGNGLDVCPVCSKPTTIGKPQTNADRIRAMTDEQLAAYIGHASLCVTIQGEDGGAWCSQYGSCNECIRDWLREEAHDES